MHNKGVYIRHQALLSLTEEWYKDHIPGAQCRRDVQCHAQDAGRVDTILHNPYGDTPETGIDVTVVNSAAASHIGRPAAEDGLHPLREAERAKEKRHHDACKGAGKGYESAVFTVYGAIGGKFLERVLRRYLLEIAEAKRAKESTWAVTARHHRFLDRVSILICKLNYAIIKALPDRHPSSPTRSPPLGGWTSDSSSDSGSASPPPLYSPSGVASGSSVPSYSPSDVAGGCCSPTTLYRPPHRRGDAGSWRGSPCSPCSVASGA